MFRISVVNFLNGAVTLRIDGQVTGHGVEELRRSGEEVLSRGAQLTLDLAGVSFIHCDGITLLQSFKGQGVILTNPSAFVAEQLKGHP